MRDGFAAARFRDRAEHEVPEIVGGEVREDGLVGGEPVAVRCHRAGDGFADAGGEVGGEDGNVLAKEQAAAFQAHAQRRRVGEGAGVRPVDAVGDAGGVRFAF